MESSDNFKDDSSSNKKPHPDEILSKILETKDGQYVVYNYQVNVKIGKDPSEILQNDENKREEKNLKNNKEKKTTKKVPCKYGNNCYRQDQDHIRDEHPRGFVPKPKPGNKPTKHCQYGNKCYSTNPAHIREWHPRGFTPAPKP